MIDDELYKEIRPYRDHEFKEVMEKLLSSPSSDILISTVFPGFPIESVKTQLRAIDNINDFQEQVIYKAVMGVLSKTSSGLNKSGLENLDKKSAYLFISNHRDIILDPSLLNTVIVEQGFKTAEVAIGDNLLETEWVNDLARLNKSFIVKRNLPVRELIASSKLLSSYIRDNVVKKKQSVWIAQREGRAKDGNDRTQQGLLNMIGLSAQSSLKEHFISLNIIPYSVSYENDPCDVDKLRSLYAMKHFGGYTKEENEDNLAMRKGILGYKGNIHVHFGKPISEKIAKLPDDLHKNELIQQICLILDKEIIGNYHIHTSNLIAYHLLNGIDGVEKGDYTEEEKQKFIRESEDKIDGMAGDPDELKTIFLEMYARPYSNKLTLTK